MTGWAATNVTRRRVLGSVALAGGAAALGACGALATNAPARTAEPVQIRFSHAVDPGGFDQAMERNARLFEEAQPRVRVLVELPAVSSGVSQTQTVLTQITAGTPPDATYFTTKQMPSYTSIESLLDLDASFNRDRTFDRNDFFPAALEYGEDQGKHYGAPYHMGTVVQFYNQSLLERTGTKLPSQYDKEGQWTFDAYLEVLKQATRGTGETRTWGLASVAGSGVDVTYSWLWPFGGDVWDKELKASLVTSPGTLAAVQWMADLRQKHQVAPAAEEAKQLNPGGLQSGRIAFTQGIRGNTVVPLTQTPPSFQIGMVPYPKGPSGRVTRGTPFLAGILKPSKHQAETWEWVKFMTTLPAQRTWLQMQGTLPGRKSVLRSGDFQRTLLPWERADVYQQSLDTLRVTKLPRSSPDIDPVWQKALDDVFAGAKSTPAAMAEIKPVIDTLLQAKR